MMRRWAKLTFVRHRERAAWLIRIKNQPPKKQASPPKASAATTCQRLFANRALAAGSQFVLVDRAGKPTHLQCAECDEIDPLRMPEVIAWTESEGLKPPTK